MQEGSVSPKALNWYFIGESGNQEELGAATGWALIVAATVVSGPPAIIRLEG